MAQLRPRIVPSMPSACLVLLSVPGFGARPSIFWRGAEWHNFGPELCPRCRLLALSQRQVLDSVEDHIHLWREAEWHNFGPELCSRCRLKFVERYGTTLIVPLVSTGEMGSQGLNLEGLVTTCFGSVGLDPKWVVTWPRVERLGDHYFAFDGTTGD